MNMQILMHFKHSVFLTPIFLGQRLLQYKSDVLETVVLVNPSEGNIAIEVIIYNPMCFFTSPSPPNFFICMQPYNHLRYPIIALTVKYNSKCILFLF